MITTPVKKIAIASAIVLILCSVLSWSPWLDSRAVKEKVLREKGRSGGTISPDGTVICDYTVMRIPFGRWVTNCEGGWVVTFWGSVL